MRIEEFDFNLPSSLIAQYPSSQRGDSRLMVIDRHSGEIQHRTFQDLADFLRPRDLVVMNNTRVLPARLIGKKETGGKCEILLIPSRNGPPGEWEALIKDVRKIRPGTRIQFGEGFSGDILEVKGGKAKIRFTPGGEVMDLLQKFGHIPLPPYIRRPDEPQDRERYQTILAEKDGSIAAPTAGLHFTHSLLQSIQARGVHLTRITLHVGIGTFAPVRVQEIQDHIMETEWVEIPETVAQSIEETKQTGGRVIAVGTTTTRALESVADSQGGVKPGQHLARLFIYPGYCFRIIDALITNFHLPKSTLIMLVSALVGKDFLMKAYKEAIAKKYRFYSYGDAMLIL